MLTKVLKAIKEDFRKQQNHKQWERKICPPGRWSRNTKGDTGVQHYFLGISPPS